ncbi:flagellar FliL protein [Duganella sp. 3397]|uniref:flagellar basal body-associated FliL family protein n=1 Tax=Duganella sp. 3397 TaxID=2817732 RepID=UPI002856006B|nr:flagellar basal body-associated FliL family protein [Duganella sp. 3397]MDR7051440.1 flagellar FliL protein [Duganella sp. 3397]
MNKKIIVAIALVVVVGAAVAGGAFWYMSKGADHAEETSADGKKAAKKEEKKKEGPPKYLTVDKVIIMLKRSPGDTTAHYMSADLVITTDEKTAGRAKEHLPMLRSVAVRTLSSLPLATAQSMTIDQFAAELNKAFDAAYEHDGMEKPFSDVMIGKLIIE